MSLESEKQAIRAWRQPVGEEPVVDYVIVDWGTPELADEAYRSLRTAEVPHTAMVVDAKRFGWSYAQSVNWGVARGRAPIVCALNADVECLDPQDALVALFEDDRVAVVGPRQIDMHGFVRHAGVVGTNESPSHRAWGELLADVAPSIAEAELDVVTVSGSVYYARRSTFEELGGFGPFPHYYEETWFSYLARHRGHRVLYSALSTWLHHWNSSPVSESWKQEKFLESQALFRAACAREGIVCD